jgi:hypothetical protein
MNDVLNWLINDEIWHSPPALAPRNSAKMIEYEKGIFLIYYIDSKPVLEEEYGRAIEASTIKLNSLGNEEARTGYYRTAQNILDVEMGW